MNAAEISLLITLIQAALTEGKDLYDAYQLKQMADLEVKLQAQLAQTHQDRAEVNANIDARHKALEDELK